MIKIGISESKKEEETTTDGDGIAKEESRRYQIQKTKENSYWWR